MIPPLIASKEDCDKAFEILNASVEEAAAKQLHGIAYYVSNPAEVVILRNKTFPEGTLNKGCVGLSAAEISATGI